MVVLYLNIYSCSPAFLGPMSRESCNSCFRGIKNRKGNRVYFKSLSLNSRLIVKDGCTNVRPEYWPVPIRDDNISYVFSSLIVLMVLGCKQT